MVVFRFCAGLLLDSASWSLAATPFIAHVSAASKSGTRPFRRMPELVELGPPRATHGISEVILSCDTAPGAGTPLDPTVSTTYEGTGVVVAVTETIDTTS